MPTREEIKEGLYLHLCKRDKGMDFTLTEEQQQWLVVHSIKYLHSQGVVIVVEGKLPDTRWKQGSDRDSWKRQGQQDMIDAGFDKKTIPLIKE